LIDARSSSISQIYAREQSFIDNGYNDLSIFPIPPGSTHPVVSVRGHSSSLVALPISQSIPEAVMLIAIDPGVIFNQLLLLAHGIANRVAALPDEVLEGDYAQSACHTTQGDGVTQEVAGRISRAVDLAGDTTDRGKVSASVLAVGSRQS
jgi:hypothetical protein